MTPSRCKTQASTLVAIREHPFCKEAATKLRCLASIRAWMPASTTTPPLSAASELQTKAHMDSSTFPATTSTSKTTWTRPMTNKVASRTTAVGLKVKVRSQPTTEVEAMPLVERIRVAVTKAARSSRCHSVTNLTCITWASSRCRCSHLNTIKVSYHKLRLPRWLGYSSRTMAQACRTARWDQTKLAGQPVLRLVTIGFSSKTRSESTICLKIFSILNTLVARDRWATVVTPSEPRVEHRLKAHPSRLESSRSSNRTSQHQQKGTSCPAREATRIHRTLKRKQIAPQSRNFTLKTPTRCSSLNTTRIKATTCMKQQGTTPSAHCIIPRTRPAARAWSWTSPSISHHRAKRGSRVPKSLPRSQPRSPAKVDPLSCQQDQAFKASLNWNRNYPKGITRTRIKTLSSYLLIIRSNPNSNLVSRLIREWTQCKTPAHWEPTCKEVSTPLQMQPSNSRPRSCRYINNKTPST